MFSKKIRFEAYKLLHARFVLVRERLIWEGDSPELLREYESLKFNMGRIIDGYARPFDLAVDALYN